jgi:hypothetical protein
MKYKKQNPLYGITRGSDSFLFNALKLLMKTILLSKTLKRALRKKYKSLIEEGKDIFVLMHSGRGFFERRFAHR